ncbi:MAG: hypothetical protein WA708_17730 [Acidobacteriaceae bacterium]
MTRNFWKWLPAAYIMSMAVVMLGYVYYDPFQIDRDAVSYMDIGSAILHGRWHETVNGLWNPGYPALLALGKQASPWEGRFRASAPAIPEPTERDWP